MYTHTHTHIVLTEKSGLIHNWLIYFKVFLRVCVCSSLPTQRPADSGLLHAPLAHWSAAVDWPHSARQGGGREREVSEPRVQVETVKQHMRHELNLSSLWRYMKDVPALLNHCFGPNSVSGEFYIVVQLLTNVPLCYIVLCSPVCLLWRSCI